MVPDEVNNIGMQNFKHIILVVRMCAHSNISLGNIHRQNHLSHNIFIH
jgi:hypothetical protein